MSKKDKPNLSLEEEEQQVLAIASAHGKMVWMVLAVMALIVAFHFYSGPEEDDVLDASTGVDSLQTDSLGIPLDSTAVPAIDSVPLMDTKLPLKALPPA